jgi:hypothetical protein
MIRSPAAQALKVLSKSGAPGHVEAASGPVSPMTLRSVGAPGIEPAPLNAIAPPRVRVGAGNRHGVRPGRGGTRGSDGNQRRGHRGADQELGEEHVFHR